MDSTILNQLSNLGKEVDFEGTKPKRGRKKKIDTKINEVEENDVREKRERLVACVLSGNSKQYLGKEYTEQQINEMDCNNVNTLLNRYESVLSTQMTKSLGKSIINLCSNIACSALGIGNQQDLTLSHLGGGQILPPPQETFLNNSKIAQGIKMKFLKFNLTPMGVILHTVIILINFRCCHGNL